jgi:bifunctional DNA-binding transcriptional regulator/antitoxin component of YhaV-PrlF toxin-antitoxin module
MSELRKRLAISEEHLRQVNDLLLDPNSTVINEFLAIVEKHGGPEAINREAQGARRLPNLLARLEKEGSPYLADVEWLARERDRGAFVTVEEFRRGVLGGAVERASFDEEKPVTLEISALQFFPWLIAEARQAIENREVMPGRFIRVRSMSEQVKDRGDTLAVAAAMQIVGASYVETLDTKGTDGSNIHLGGPATITGYFGGVGQPNDHALRWVDEFLGYYREYGIRQVLNVNPGTVLLGYLLHKLGIDIEFKISVYMGNDNPYAALWTLIGAKLFAREDGTTSLIGFNWANSVDNATIERGGEIRRALGLESVVRFEHHITETQKSIVLQPYDRTEELLDLAQRVANISAKHEGGIPAVDSAREHPSDILDYFTPKAEIEAQGLMGAMERNYLDKHDALNRTAVELTKRGLAFVAARNLHRRSA